MADPLNEFLKAQETAAQLGAAKTANISRSPFQALMDVLGGAYSAYGNGQRSGTIIPGVMNAMQNWREGDYINKLQQQAAQQQAFERANNALKNKKLYGDGWSGFQGTLTADEGNKAMEVNQNPNLNTYLKGGQLQVDPNGHLDPELIKQNMQRFGTISDNKATIDQIKPYADTGYSRSFGNVTGPAIKGQPVTPQIQPPKDQSPNSGTPTVLVAGTQETAPPKPNPLFQTNPFGVGVADPAQLNTAMGHGITARNNAETNMENSRHNQATEKLGRDIYTATKNNQGGYAKYPPSGGQGQDPNLALGRQQENIIRQVKAIEAQMTGEGLVDKNGQFADHGGFLGMGADPNNAARKARYQQLSAYRNSLLGLISGQSQGGYSGQPSGMPSSPSGNSGATPRAQAVLHSLMGR